MLFSIKELKEFAKDHEDERIRILWRRFSEARSKNAQWCDEVVRLKAINEHLEKSINLHNKDWCEDDENIKKQALRVLPAEKVEGDSWHVPRMAELAEMITDHAVALQQRLDIMDSFYKLTVNQRDMAWKELENIKSKTKD